METKTSKNVSPSERRLQKQNKRLMKENEKLREWVDQLLCRIERMNEELFASSMSASHSAEVAQEACREYYEHLHAIAKLYEPMKDNPNSIFPEDFPDGFPI